MSRLSLILPTLLALVCVPAAPSAATSGAPTVARDAPAPDRPARPALPADVETEEDDSRDERASDDLVDLHHNNPHNAPVVGVIDSATADQSSPSGRRTCAPPRAPPLV